MYPLFETVCIENGQLQHTEYHENRFLKSYIAYFKIAPTFSLFNTVDTSSLNPKLKYKLKICYNKTSTSWTTSEYKNKLPTTLQTVTANHIEYTLKFYNRKNIDELRHKRNGAEDVLIIKNNLVTDTSYANILFKKDNKIVTPKHPLLKGTCRARLLKSNIIEETDINSNQIATYSHFQLINALNDFDANKWTPTKDICTSN